MAGVKISQLPAIVAPALSDIFPVVQSGTTYKETITQLASLVSSNIASNSITNAMLAQMGAYTIKGNNTNATANPQDIAAGQFPATHTNDSATTGNVGQYKESIILNGSAVAVPTATATNITSLSLEAGDWDCYGNINLSVAGTTTTNFLGWISTTSAIAPDQSSYAGPYLTTAQDLSTGYGVVVPYKRISLAATTTVYLSAVTTYSAGAATVCGGLCARRAR